MNILKILLLFIFSTFLYGQSDKNILILNSYHKGFTKSDYILRSIEEVFYNYPQINVDTLYMDSKQVFSRDYIKELGELYKLQLQNRKYDLIIAIDSFAYLFAVKNHSIIFKGEPILFAGLETYSKELVKIYNLESKVNGLIEKISYKENLNLIEKMIPNLKKLYIINDRSINGNESSPYIREVIKNRKSKYEIEYLRDSTLLELIDYFKDKRDNEAIFFIRYDTTPNGNYYKESEVATALNNFQLPVFTVYDLFLNKGILGGKILSLEDSGKRVANMAIDIIYENTSLPNFEENFSHKYIFDYNYLEKYSITIPSNLNNVEVFNKPKSYFDKHREFINKVFISSPFLIILIFILIKLLIDKQKSEKQLMQRVEFDKILLNSIDNPIFWQDSKGVVLDANKKFCEIANIKYENLIGYDLNHFYHTNKDIKRIVKHLEKYEENMNRNKIVIKDIKEKPRTYFINKKSYFDQKSENFSTVTLFVDLTKELEFEKQKEKQTQYIIQQSKLAEIGEIFSSIAHQWKAPLVEITALAQDLFFIHRKDEKEEDSYHINKIMVQVQYMTKTINDFQEFIIPSKKKTYFDLLYVLKDLLNIVKHNLKYNYIQVNINKKENETYKIYGYQNEFMQALLNIINNAKEALLNNNEKDRVIDININKRFGYIIVDIIDNGPGINNILSEKIFDQYYSTKKDGHGIGLYMTKLIIEDKLRGRIKYKHIKKGSCFRIVLKDGNENIST